MRATVEQERAVSEKYLKRISLENLKRFLAELSELGRRDGREKNKKPRIAAGVLGVYRRNADALRN